MTKSLPMSRFIQNYNQHLSEAERTGSPIVLEQRAGRPSWVLDTADHVQAATSATDFLSAALAAVAHDPQLTARLAAGLTEALPWTGLLPEEERELFTVAATDTLRACASINSFGAFAQLIEDWRATAQIWADPNLAAALSEPIDEPLDLPVR